MVEYLAPGTAVPSMLQACLLLELAKTIKFSMKDQAPINWESQSIYAFQNWYEMMTFITDCV